MRDATLLVTRYAGRPLLLEPRAARELAERIRASDPRAFQRPGRLSAFLRKAGLMGGVARQPLAWDDDGEDLPPPPPMEERLAYQPRWAGEVEDTGFCWSLKDGVALICCDTPLVANGDEFCGVVWHGYDTLLMAIREATADARVGGVFMVLDTPGGVVDDGLPKLAEFMRASREAAGGKPIWVYAKMACSAGYWVASQADRIIAPASGYVGSNGAVIVHESYAGALEQEGIEITSIEFPDGGEKTDGAWWKALSESARAAWKADVEQCGRWFFADVEAGRPQLTYDKLLALRAAVFMAEHDEPERSGLAIGLVDAIAHEEDAFAQLVAHIGGETTLSVPADITPGQPSQEAAADKEKPMAVRALTAAEAARKTKLEAELAKLNAKTAKPKAEDHAEGEAEEGDPDEDEDGAADPAPEVDEAPASEADAIAASAEARAHPQAALAAIRDGLTLKQFKGQVGAGGSRGPSKLDAALSRQARLGPDAAKPAGERTPYSSAIAAQAAKNRGERAESQA